MCGIVGIVGHDQATEILLQGLEKLEYRGYDSAGIYVLKQANQGFLRKASGRISNLRQEIDAKVSGNTGIGHTRWATHGQPSQTNAHPHSSADGRFYLVHNGVVGNFKELKETYLKDVTLVSQTDTEVIVQLIGYFAAKENLDAFEALRKVVGLLDESSSYALALIDQTQPEKIWIAKNKSPLLLGLGTDFNCICSDAMAMLKLTNRFVELADGDVAQLSPKQTVIEDVKGNVVKRKEFTVDQDASASEKGAYEHYMLKEIDEQPAVMRTLVQKYLQTPNAIDEKLLAAMKQAQRIYIVAAGTSYHAGLVGKELFEKLAQIPVEVHVASEFAYNPPLLAQKPFFIFLSQSGETADSRSVLVQIKEQNYPALTLTNVANSTLSREADYTLLLHAGPEIAVASTKAYTAQIAVEAILAQALGKAKDLQRANELDLAQELGKVANAMQTLVDEKYKIEQLAKQDLLTTRNAFYIGRAIDYATAIEAALKLKEVSYIQTEGFAAGELKHGTIALIEEQTPVIALITSAKTAAHTRSNVQEVKAREAQVITIVKQALATKQDQIILPDVAELLSPLVAIVPCQLLAYYASKQRGYDVDKPRNLAKSVTVE